MRKGGRTEGN